MAAATTPRKPAAKRTTAPQDRKPRAIADAQKAEARGEAVTVTCRDREWIVSAESVTDFEFLEDVGDVQRGNPFALPSAMKRLLGEEQYTEAKTLLRGDDGHLDVEDVTDFFVELFQAANPNS